jgi:hypothetical protein
MNALHDEEMDATVAARTSEIPFYGDLIQNSENLKTDNKIRMKPYVEKISEPKKTKINMGSVEKNLSSGISNSSIALITPQGGIFSRVAGGKTNNYNSRLISNTGIGSSPGLSAMYGNQNQDMVRNSLADATPGVGKLFENFNINNINSSMINNASVGSTPAGTSFGSIMTDMGTGTISGGTSVLGLGLGF